jgi:hypothetical protein
MDIRDEVEEEVKIILALPEFHVNRSRNGIRGALKRFGEIHKIAWSYNKFSSSVLWVYLNCGTKFHIELGFRLRG